MPTSTGVPTAQANAAKKYLSNSGIASTGGDSTGTLAHVAGLGGSTYGQVAQSAANSGANPYQQAQAKFAQTSNFSNAANQYQQQGLAKAQSFADAHAAWQQRQDDAAQRVKDLAAARAQGASDATADSADANGVKVTWNGDTTDERSKIVNAAMSEQGTPYAWGGGGYHNSGSQGKGMGTQNVVGVDCSGLTSYAYGAVGIQIPRKSNIQTTTMGYRTSVKNLKPGDLVGFYNRDGSVMGHVAMYIGNGQIVEASRPGTVVRTRSVSGLNVFGVHIQLPGD